MKKLNSSWEGIHDDTGYLFSFAKSLACAVKNSPWFEYAEDIIATSGFAFRMWIAPDLCPSSTSIWDFDNQKLWVESGGLSCDYVGRYWEQADIEEEQRLKAIDIIKKSIDNGVPAISWDISYMEWGLITGYDDETQMFYPLSLHAGYTNPKKDPFLFPYNWLGNWQLPILSVLTIKGKSEKSQEDILQDAIKLAISHLSGEEWCENASGLDAYPALMCHFKNGFDFNLTRNAEYCLGTFGSLKYYAWKYFEKMKQTALCSTYYEIFRSWQNAYKIKSTEDATCKEVCERIFFQLNMAYDFEKKAFDLMKKACI